MSSRVVIDTSVIFKWFVAYGENGLDEAWSLLRDHQQGPVTLIAPALAAVEVTNLLRCSGIGADDARALLNDFELAHVVAFETTPDRLQRALSCAFENCISVYDAIFLSLAQEFDCPLVTADRRAFGTTPRTVADVQLIP